MNKILVIVVSILLSNCKSNPTQKTDKLIEKDAEIKEYTKATDIELKFLDEYVYPAKVNFKETIIGGLSGIDYDKSNYYLVADDPKKPRFYKAEIKVANNKIDTIIFKDVVIFDKKSHPFFKNHLDLESIVYRNNNLIISSEGRIVTNSNPTIFEVDEVGKFVSEFTLSDKFLAKSKQKPRNNGVFEGLTNGFDKKGIWSAIELPLKTDGTMPTYPTTTSPVRFSYYDVSTKKVTKEFVYELSPLPRKEKGSINISGLTAVLEYKPNQFLVVERTYQKSYIGDENIVKIYKATIGKNTTNTLVVDNLKENKYTPMKKELVFDFSSIKSKLTDSVIDNIEGITFTKNLSNGNKAILLISDDNFQAYGKQKNQFILLEVINK